MATKRAKSTTEAASESFFSRTLLAPILFISFLFSLLWIDRKTSAEIFTHETKSERRKGSESKYYHSNQRHLAKREFDEAFAYQGNVVAMICVASAVVLAGGSWVVWRLWQWNQGAAFWNVGKGAGEI